VADQLEKLSNMEKRTEVVKLLEETTMTIKFIRSLQ
jgi:hypothetical protein